MSTPLRELYEHTREKHRLRLLGGESGLCNAVTWIYISEDIQNVPFLEGGELAITTGLFIQSGVSLMDYIQALIVHNSSGLLINTGKYIQSSDITPDILALCDRCGFPVMILPWEVHLVEVMQDFSFILMRNIQSTEMLNAALENALYQNPVQENVLRLAERYGFPNQAVYKLALIQSMPNSANAIRGLDAIGLKYHLFTHESLRVLLYQAPAEKKENHKISEILCYCDSIRIGFSDAFPALADLGRGYQQARFAMAAAVFWQRNMVNFEELGMLQVLFYTTDTQRLVMLQKKHLGALAQYDLVHHAGYLETLHSFLVYGSVLETANHIHTHRNTVIYRLKRIQEILNVDLNSATIRYDLFMAFMIREYLHIQQNDNPV